MGLVLFSGAINQAQASSTIATTTISDLKQSNVAGEVLSLPETIDQKIAKHAKKYNLKLEVVREIIKRESGFNPTICNETFGCDSGAGLFQIIPSTLASCERDLKVKLDVFNPDDNLACGTFLLARDGLGHWDDFSWKTEEPKKWGSGPYIFPNGIFENGAGLNP